MSRLRSSRPCPSAMVRTMSPASLGLSSLEMSRRRSRSPWLEAAGDADAAPAGHVHQVAPGQRDLGAQPGALVAHRVLGDLHQHLLAVLERVGDAPGALLALRRRHLVDVEEAVLLEAEVDERGVDAVHDVLDLALVDVAQVRLAVGPLDVDLGEAAVLDQRDAQLFAVVGDEDDLALRALGDDGRAAAGRARSARWCRGRCPRPAGRWPWGAGGRAAGPSSWPREPAPRPALVSGAGSPPRVRRPGPPRARRPRRPRPRARLALAARAPSAARRRAGDASPRSRRPRPPRILRSAATGSAASSGRRRCALPEAASAATPAATRLAGGLLGLARRLFVLDVGGLAPASAAAAAAAATLGVRLVAVGAGPSSAGGRLRRRRSRLAGGGGGLGAQRASSRRQPAGPAGGGPPRGGCAGRRGRLRRLGFRRLRLLRLFAAWRADRPSPRLRSSRRPAAPRRCRLRLGAGRLLPGGAPRRPPAAAHRDQRRGGQVCEARPPRRCSPSRGVDAVPGRSSPAGRARPAPRPASPRPTGLLCRRPPRLPRRRRGAASPRRAVGLVHVRGAALGVRRRRRLVAGRALLRCAHEVNSFRRRA